MLLSSSGNNRSVKLTTHFIANVLIALVDGGEGGQQLSMKMIKIVTPAHNVLSFSIKILLD